MGRLRASTATDYVLNKYFDVLKSGKISKVPQYRTCYFTPLMTCFICKRVSTPKNINRRTLGYRVTWVAPFGTSYKDSWKFWNENNENILCTKCWNKVVQIFYQEKMLTENINLTKQLTTWIYRERKKPINNN